MKLSFFVIWVILVIGLGAITSCTTNQKPGCDYNDFNYVIGTQTVGSKYKFTDETMLVETAKQIKNMGSNLLKFSSMDKLFFKTFIYCFSSGLERTMRDASEKHIFA